MSDPSAPPADPGHERVAPAIGLVLVTLATLSLLDDTDVLHSSPWLPFVLAMVVGALAIAVRTVLRLRQPPPPPPRPRAGPLTDRSP
ncbi:MAG: hypothetical protein JWM47_3721 [Acidimicrobiales bacterium]|nr:hypothetical protein [Acidimicrobiales bacterium]